MYQYIIFYKPFGTLCQFSGEGITLANYNLPPQVYSAGRLDKDSEGLLLLTDDGKFNQKITHPRYEKEKTYHVQVDGEVKQESLDQLLSGVHFQDYFAAAKRAVIISPQYPPREPPIRVRKSIPTTWIELVITEGKNRQVRKMTAAIGHPTLRLIRTKIGNYSNNTLTPGQWLRVTPEEIL